MKSEECVVCDEDFRPSLNFGKWVEKWRFWRENLQKNSRNFYSVYSAYLAKKNWLDRKRKICEEQWKSVFCVGYVMPPCDSLLEIHLSLTLAQITLNANKIKVDSIYFVSRLYLHFVKKLYICVTVSLQCFHIDLSIHFVFSYW